MSKSFASLVFPLMLASFAATGCKDDHGHSHDGKSAATTPAGGGGEDHPNRIEIGDIAVNGLKIKALQDKPVKAGEEAAFDLQITGYPAGGKPKAVRFWVGNETGEGSTRAKAEEETPDNWHTHAEVPKPIPAGAKLWAEIEPATGEKFKVSFDLK